MKSSTKSELKSLIVIVFLALVIRTFVFELFYVPTGSMRATILEGDYIFSTKYDYGYSIYSIPFNPDIFSGRIFDTPPERGDVIIMRPPHDMEQRYIKRLIGLPGDKIEIIDYLIYINDKPIERVEVGTYVSEDNIEYIKFRETLPNNVSYFSYKYKNKPLRFDVDISNYGPKIVEDDKYFFLGDNRDNSGDSRYQLQTVDRRNFIAKGRFVLFSTKIPLWDLSNGFFEQITRIGTWISSIRFNRISSSMYK
jgi:signal peptidase I